ncbi:MAG: response regulator [Proteobacteria bacterium]|nr:response regulator [Pseudomonadota bacterium]
MSETPRILLIEDDERLAKLIKEYLVAQGFLVAIEGRGDTGSTRILTEQPDLVILDLMLPGMDGLTVCRTVRQEYSGPVLMLTAREDDTDQVVGLELGADDYVKKPVEPRVLLARIRALLRRFSQPQHNGRGESETVEELVFGSLRISQISQTVTLCGIPVDLTSNEFALLWILAVHGGRTLDREMLFRETRGIAYDGLDRSVDIAISRLRKKLGDNATKPWRIKTVWGLGYLFVKDAWDDNDYRSRY